VVRLGPQGAGADQHDVGEGAQQTHQEAIGREAPADQPALPGGGGVDGADAVERGDEVGVEERLGEAELAVVQLGQRGRQLLDREAGLFEEQLEWCVWQFGHLNGRRRPAGSPVRASKSRKGVSLGLG
jgi:hypothetical protein